MLYAIDPPLFECHLKYANSGLTYMKDAVSGGKTVVYVEKEVEQRNAMKIKLGNLLPL